MAKKTDRVDKYLIESKKHIDKLLKQKGKIYDIVKILKNSDTIFICGNGGSSATASHMANDLQKMCGLRAFCLTDNTPLVTALANDEDYSMIFVRQLEELCLDKTAFWDETDETIIIFSGSGNSKNLVEVAKWGIENYKHVIAFLGQDGGVLGNMNNVHKIHIKSDMLHAEDWHLIIEHLICNLIST